MEVELRLKKIQRKFRSSASIGSENQTPTTQSQGLSLPNLRSSKAGAFVLAQAKNLRGTNFAVACDFLKEIGEKRKLLVPMLKDAKKSGDDANLIYDKLYINGQLYRP